MSHERKSSGRDHLTLTTEQGKIELAEEQLSRVTGAAAVDYLKYNTAFKYDAFLKI